MAEGKLLTKTFNTTKKKLIEIYINTYMKHIKKSYFMRSYYMKKKIKQ